ncbi:hypothetical protein OXPF_27390 [Oxobacter pfennigii]|uniref:Uncharacterized protein n=1 Tax=Oxobacter pfennigii TaxID=36849 RepID=A0A0P8Y941_9CLOT|nr:hypothetical protein [Oxobacter pfennigii]KPU43298.1 hypothetical protein OXPF_27390 [Oxobacter pfennigii]
MKLLKHSAANAIFIAFMSSIYAFLFIFTSDHIEFQRLLKKTNTLQSDFWNRWSDFIRAGNMKYIGYMIIILAIIIILLMISKRKIRYDEYQVSMLSKGIIAAGLLSIFIMPLIIVTLLSDPSYMIETIFLFTVIQWFGVLLTDIIYVIKY